MGRLDFEALADGFRDRVRRELSPQAAAAVADTQAFIDAGQPPLTPEERAAYEHRVVAYRTSGTPQRDLDLEPPSCA